MNNNSVTPSPSPTQPTLIHPTMTSVLDVPTVIEVARQHGRALNPEQARELLHRHSDALISAMHQAGVAAMVRVLPETQPTYSGLHRTFFRATSRTLSVHGIPYAQVVRFLGTALYPRTDDGDGKVRAEWWVAHRDGRRLALWDYRQSQPIEEVMCWSGFGDRSLAEEIFGHQNVGM